MKLPFALQLDKAIPIQYVFLELLRAGLMSELEKHLSSDDSDVLVQPSSDFQQVVQKAGWEKTVVYLQRGEEFAF